MDVQRISLDEADSAFLTSELPTGETVTVDVFFDMITETSPVITTDTASEITGKGMYYWCLDNLETTPSGDMDIFWRMKAVPSGRLYYGHLIIGGYADDAKANAVTLNTIDGIVDDILEDTGTTLPATLSTIDGIVDAIVEDTGLTIPGTISTLSGKVDTIDGIVDDILVDTAQIGTAVALDGGAATLGGMLTKMADDNGGADFDATTDSLTEIAAGESTSPTVVQIREEMDANSTQLAAIVLDTGTTIPATLTAMEGKIDTVDGVVDDVLVDTNDIVNKMESGSLPPNPVQYE